MPNTPIDTPVFDNLIIGGGISGLGLGHLCARKGLKTLILEKDAQPGGCIHSHTFEGTEGFWAELGSHTCYNSYGNLLQIADDLGMAGDLKPKGKVSFKVLEGDELVSIASRLHFLELAFNVPRLFTEKKTGRSVRQYYSRVLGEKNYRELFGPAFNAVICQPAGDFPADMLFRKKPRRKDMPKSFTLEGGLSTMIQAIANQQGLETRAGVDVQRIERDGDGFMVTGADGIQLKTRHLSLATAPDVAGKLLAELAPEAAAELNAIEMSSIESVSIAVLTLAVGLDPIAGIIAPDDAFYAAVSRDYCDDRLFRGFTFHFQPGRLSEEQQLERICQVLKLTPDEIENVVRRENRLPALRVGHHDKVANIDRALADSGIALTGNYFIGVSIEDCLTRSAAEFERMFAKRG